MQVSQLRLIFFLIELTASTRFIENITPILIRCKTNMTFNYSQQPSVISCILSHLNVSLLFPHFTKLSKPIAHLTTPPAATHHSELHHIAIYILNQIIQQPFHGKHRIKELYWYVLVTNHYRLPDDSHRVRVLRLGAILTEVCFSFYTKTCVCLVCWGNKVAKAKRFNSDSEWSTWNLIIPLSRRMVVIPLKCEFLVF